MHWCTPRTCRVVALKSETGGTYESEVKPLRPISRHDCDFISLLLADKAHNRVYQLDKKGQEKAHEFAGQKVKVTGQVTGKTIKVTSIEAAS